jgi:hypothetical protein
MAYSGIYAQTIQIEGKTSVLVAVDTIIIPKGKLIPPPEANRNIRPAIGLRGAVCTGTQTINGCNGPATINRSCVQANQYFSYARYHTNTILGNLACFARTDQNCNISTEGWGMCLNFTKAVPAVSASTCYTTYRLTTDLTCIGITPLQASQILWIMNNAVAYGLNVSNESDRELLNKSIWGITNPSLTWAATLPMAIAAKKAVTTAYPNIECRLTFLCPDNTTIQPFVLYSGINGGNPLSVGGFVSPNQTICLGQNSVPTTPSVSGYLGKIVRWEYATPGGGWVNWGGAGSTNAPGNCCFNAVGVWRIRAIIQNGTCPEVASSEATVTVNTPSVGGALSPNNQTICEGQNSVPTTPTLSGYTGTILRWEYATPGGGWNNWNGGGNATAPGNCCFGSPGIWKVRAIIKSGGCAEAASGEAWITVVPLPKVFTVTGGGTYCAGTGGVSVGLNGSENGYYYNLFRDGAYIGQLIGNGGALNFGNQTITGNYTIQGYNTPLNFACTKPMSGAVRVDVTPVTVGGTVAANAPEVCASQSNFPVGFFNLSGQLGTIVRWEWSNNNTTWNDWGGGGSTASPSGWIDYDATFSVRVVVKNGVCNQTYSTPSTVRVYPQTVGGTVSPSQSICLGQNSVPTTPTLSGHIGTILRWEYATPGGGWNNWNGGGNATAPGNCCFSSVGIWKVRAIVKSGVCAEVASNEAWITVNPNPIITSQPVNQTICQGNQATFTVAATGATAVQWEYSGDNGANWANAGEAGNNTPTLTASNPTVLFRARVGNAQGCLAYSNAVRVTITPVSVGGTVTANAPEVCASQNNFPTGFFNLSGQVGTIVRWEWSNNNTTWNDWGGAGSTASPSGWIDYNATFYVRVVVKNGVCNQTYSTTSTVRVYPPTVGGTLNAKSPAICASQSNFPVGFFTLSGQTGTIVRWEWSINNTTWNDWGGAGSAASPSGWIDYDATFYVRVLIKSGVCAQAYSATKTVTVTVSPTLPTQPVGFTECIGGTQVLSVVASSTTSYQWQSSPDGITWTNIANATTANYTPLSTTPGTTRYRVVVSNAVCAALNSNPISVIIVNKPTINVTSPVNTVCVNGIFTLSATQSGGVNTCSFQWQSSPNGVTWTNINGATGTTYNVVNIASTLRYRAQLVACSGNGCCN